MYKKNQLTQLIAPAAIMVLGLILLINPDSASAFLSRLVGWILTAAGFVLASAALLGDRSRWVRRAFTAGVLIAIGIWLRANPLAIAAWAGRLAGILLLFQGMPMAILGVILIIVPMTTSRILISASGVMILCVGLAMAVDRFRRPHLEEGRPDIIDADE